MTLLAPSTSGFYELAGDGVTWNLIDAIYEVQGDGTKSPLTFRFDVVSPQAPSAVTDVRQVRTTATTVTIRWTEAGDATVAGHRVYVNGVRYGSALGSNVLSTTISGLAASTTYRITVRRYNNLGESADSNVLTATTAASPGGSVPAAPTGLSRSNLTATGVTVTWSETADATVTSHRAYVNGVAYGTVLSATATSVTITGLSASTAYTVYVTRSNASGESDASGTISFTTLSGGGGTTSPYLYGVSNSNYAHPGTWQVMRVYSFGAVSDAVAAGATAVALSDGGTVPQSPATASGQQASANAFRNALTALFNAHPNLKVYYCSGNELDRTGPGGGTWTNFGDTFALLRQVADEFVAAGHFVKLGVDLTQHQIDLWLKGRTTVEDDIKNACLQYLDFLAFSMYPPGRQTSPLNYNLYSTYIDRCFDLAVAWGISEVHCWEIGIPVDDNTTHPSSTNETVASATSATIKVDIFGRSTPLTVTVAGAKQVRPTYMAYAARYIADRCHALGFPPPQLCYWDSSGGADNRFQNDPAGTSPTTLQSWRNWPTYATAN